MGKLQNLIGQKFGRLTVIKFIEHKNDHTKWLCQCECGNIKVVRADSLKNGSIKSCGCLKREISSKVNTKHKLINCRLYDIWNGMKSRCCTQSCSGYKHYGGRGISVCDEWKNDFMSFYNWAMTNGYNPKAKKGECTLDRIDHNGNYEPSNCRWITIQEQQRNTSKNTIITYKNETYCISEWSEILGINKNTIFTRIFNGWSVEKALSEPINIKCRHKTNRGKTNGSH